MNTRKPISLLCALIFPAFAAIGADSAADDAFVKSVSAMPAEQQVQAVIARLKELNPNFDGKETHKVEGGAVTELAISTVAMTDISPLRALRGLRRLSLAPSALNQKGSLTNLSPLAGMQLTSLWCHNTAISDVSPLKDMPLTVLSCGGTQVSDLSPLVGMKLTVLSCNDTLVSNLLPLKNMPLTVLWCNNTKVTDLAPLQSMPLRELKCDFIPTRDATALRSIKTLGRINDVAAGVFWARMGLVAATPTTSGIARPQTGQPLMTSIGIELVYIPAGDYMLGSTPEERAWAAKPENGAVKGDYLKWEGETPRHAVVRNGFWLGRTEVTVGQWRQFVKATVYKTEAEKRQESKGATWQEPGFDFKLKDTHPVSCISWNDATAFCEWLHQSEQKTGRLPAKYKLRLPTEVEWEYACRGGKQASKFWWGDTKEGGDGRLNWSGAKDGYEFVAPVDRYGARGRNRFGLADMLGSVREWCLDDFDVSGAHEEVFVNGSKNKVLRGGSFASTYRLHAIVRCASRDVEAASSADNTTGFRVCCGME